MHNCSSIKGMATKFWLKTNINNIRNMTCHFLDNDAMPKNYYAVTGFLKFGKFSQISKNKSI